MTKSSHRKLWRAAGYSVGAILFLLGVLGVLIEFSKGKLSEIHFYGYVLAVLFITSGLLTCFGVWRDYTGGLWSFFGLLFVAASIARLVSLTEALARGRNLKSPIVFYAVTGALFGAGCYSLCWGHLRRHKLDENQREAGNKSAALD